MVRRRDGNRRFFAGKLIYVDEFKAANTTAMRFRGPSATIKRECRAFAT